MGYWKEKQKYKEESETSNTKPIKSKCPQNSKVEVIWKPEAWTGIELECSYSGYSNCAKCIKKNKYPPKS